MKGLIASVMERHEEELSGVEYVETFKLLRAKWEQNQVGAGAGAGVLRGPGRAGRAGAELAAWQRKELEAWPVCVHCRPEGMKILWVERREAGAFGPGRQRAQNCSCLAPPPRPLMQEREQHRAAQQRESGPSALGGGGAGGAGPAGAPPGPPMSAGLVAGPRGPPAVLAARERRGLDRDEEDYFREDSDEEEQQQQPQQQPAGGAGPQPAGADGRCGGGCMWLGWGRAGRSSGAGSAARAGLGYEAAACRPAWGHQLAYTRAAPSEYLTSTLSPALPAATGGW